MSKGWKVIPVALVAAGTIALLGGCAEGPVDEPRAAAHTAFPGLTPATGEPALSGLTSAKPEPGSVEQVDGPFDDRFELTDLTVANGVVSGTLTVTSDVSELLDLQVLAGFYDAEGNYLGSQRFDQHTLHHDEGADGHEAAFDEEHHEAAHFSVEAPARFRAQVASAAIGVPVLVNE